MSLIENLGGHANSKGVLEAYKKNGWSISDVCKGFHQYFTIEDLEKAILQYRRENNIFEVGDKVVSTLDGDEDWKNAVCEILAFHKKMAITTGFSCAIHHYEYRHATPEEIAAGRRL